MHRGRCSALSQHAGLAHTCEELSNVLRCCSKLDDQTESLHAPDSQGGHPPVLLLREESTQQTPGRGDGACSDAHASIMACSCRWTSGGRHAAAGVWLRPGGGRGGHDAADHLQDGDGGGLRRHALDRPHPHPPRLQASLCAPLAARTQAAMLCPALAVDDGPPDALTAR